MSSKLFRSAALLLLVVLLSGCLDFFARDDQVVQVWVDDKVNLNNPEAVKRVLYKQLREWRSVPNRSGGLSKRGVDCSGFVYLTYRSYFGLQLPRSTTAQARVGVEIDQEQLQPGDLVFYKTGVVQRHVGMYIGNRRFIHASSSHGVMESYMDNPYWTKNYWKSVRVRP
jgi:probable lipoprotein NlpC